MVAIVYPAPMPSAPAGTLTRARPGDRSAQLARLEAAAPWAIGALALGLGLIQLGSRAYRWDEDFTIRVSTGSVHSILHSSRTTEAPHFVYYLLMKPWLAEAGTSTWAGRTPSVVFGVLTALLVTAIGQRLFGSRAGIVAGLTLTASAYVMSWWQVARAYSLALLLTTLASYAFVRVLEPEPGRAGSRRRWTILWAVGLVAAAWINLFSICVLPAHVLAYVLQRPRRPLARPALLTGAVSAAVLPLIVLVGTANNGQLAWIPSPTLRRVALQTWDWSSRNPFALLAAGIGIAVLAAGLVPLAARWKTAFVVTWLVSPFAITLLLSAFQPAFDAHYLLTAAPALALLVGAAVAALPPRPALALFVLVAAGGALQLAHFYVARGEPLSHLF
jgi:mannosyltransferase